MKEQGTHARKLRKVNIPQQKEQGVAAMATEEVIGHPAVLEYYGPN